MVLKPNINPSTVKRGRCHEVTEGVRAVERADKILHDFAHDSAPWVAPSEPHARPTSPAKAVEEKAPI